MLGEELCFFRDDKGQVAALWDVCVPVDDGITRVVCYHTTRPGSLLGRAYERVHFFLWHNWVMNIQFSNQNAKIMVPQRYDTPE